MKKKSRNKLVINPLMVVIVALLLLILGGYLNIQSKKHLEQELIKLSKAEQMFSDQNDIIMKADQEELSSLLDELNKSSVAYVRQRSLFIAGMVAYQQQQYDDAALKFLAVVKKFPKGYLAPSAMMNAAHCYEQAGDVNSALLLFKKAGSDKKSLIWPEASFNAARLSENINLDEAVSLYQRMVAELPEANSWQKIAENRLIALGVL